MITRCEYGGMVLHRLFDNSPQAELPGEEQNNGLALSGNGQAAILFIFGSHSSHSVDIVQRLLIKFPYGRSGVPNKKYNLLYR